MRLVIVPNVLSDAIYAKIDTALKDAPEDAKECREEFYSRLLEHFDEFGTIPEFSIVKANSEPAS